MIIDAHLDIAYDAWALGRDFLLSAHEQRAREAAASPNKTEDICTVGLPDLQAGGIGLVFGSIFIEPAHARYARPGYSYTTPEEAHSQALLQIDYYQRLASAGHVRMVASRSDLRDLPPATGGPIGLVMEMEGADALRSPEDVAAIVQSGVRQIGLAWAYGSRYCGGNHAPGPLTAEGQDLLREMEQAGLILDVSHMSEESFWQALAVFHGPVVASHSNCRALVPGERQLTDDMIRGLIERDAVIGVVLYNEFLQAGWTRGQGKAAVTFADVLRHIDHICQLAGNTDHVGIGSDLDGGFGWEASPAEIDTVADSARLGPAMQSAGYSEQAARAILGGNWLGLLQRALP